MTDTVPFPTFQPTAPQPSNGAVPEPDAPRRRGPRRQAAEGEPNEAPKRKGRPPKVPGSASWTKWDSAPLSPASLFQVLAGLQTTDVVPLTSCYETLSVLAPEDRARVLGFLNRVLG
jgi:hypothetical protein